MSPDPSSRFPPGATWTASVLSLVLAALAAGSSALAATPRFSVTRVDCDWLDRTEFTRLLGLELAHTESDENLPPLTVDLSCGDGGITIAVRDPERTQKIERTVPTPQVTGAGRERQIALTVAQFAAALWRLREAEQRGPTEPAPPPPPAEPSPQTPAPPPEPSGTGLEWYLELAGGPRGRGLGSSEEMASGYGELSAAVWLLDRIGIAVSAGVEGARPDRDGGGVDAVGITVGLGLAARLLVVGRFDLDARLLLAGGYARFEGRANDPTSHRTASTSGSAGELRIGVAPTWHLGRIALALSVDGGYGLPVTIATVDGDADVSFAGWWAGGGLRIGFALGESAGGGR